MPLFPWALARQRMNYWWRSQFSRLESKEFKLIRKRHFRLRHQNHIWGILLACYSRNLTIFEKCRAEQTFCLLCSGILIESYDLQIGPYNASPTISRWIKNAASSAIVPATATVLSTNASIISGFRTAYSIVSDIPT